MLHQLLSGFRFLIGHTQLPERVANPIDGLPVTVGGKFKSTPSFKHCYHSSLATKVSPNRFHDRTVGFIKIINN